MTDPVAIVLKGYPRLSETFIAQEILALERRGMEIRLVSLRHPTDTRVHPVHRNIRAPVNYLPEYLHDEPIRVARAWRIARRKPGFSTALRLWFRDLRRDPTRNRVRRFGQALVLAAELEPDVSRIYAHFLHTPGSVARYAAAILGLPWCVSAHAKDIWTLPEWEKREKLADCDWLTTCTRYNVEHLRTLATDPERILLAYHGLDFTRFQPFENRRPPRRGDTPDDPVILFSVGRAVAKKGYNTLLDALHRLPAGLHWRLIHIGGGELGTTLREHAERLGLSDRIEWLGAQPHEVVIANYRSADLFVLACRVTEDGDRDGLPNVLMEAQSQGLACVATRVSAIPELIVDGDTGILVEPEQPAALAEALERMISDPELRQRIGANGNTHVRSTFPFERGIDILTAKFGM